MDINEIIHILSQTAAFNGLGNEQIKALAIICNYKKYSTGTEIVTEGDPGDGLSIIVEGKLRVLLPKHSKSGKERFSKVKLNTLVAGNCFGEYSLIDGHHISATIEVLENSSILKIDKNKLQKLLDNDLLMAKIMYYNLLKIFTSRLRKHDEALDLFLAS